MQVDVKSLNDLVRKLKIAERRIPRGIANVLNDVAYGTRHAAIENIERQMVVRNKPFIHSRIRVTHASPTSLKAFVGSLETEGFSLREQEYGGKSENLEKRHINLSARGGKIRRRVTPQARLKRGMKFLKPSEYRGMSRSGRGMPSGAANKAVGMLRSLSRQGYKKPFILTDHPNVKPGLYRLKGRRNKQELIQLQSFEHGTFARRRPWLSSAPAVYFRRVDRKQLVGRNLARALKLK